MQKIFYLILFLLCAQLQAQNNVLFEGANTAYNEGNYSEAIARYEQILENGEVSAELYYNLGNAYYKINNVAPSVYYYEKALQLDPNDDDIINNLAFARNMVIDDIQETPQNGFEALYNDLASSLGPNGWGWVAVTFMVLFAVFFLVYYFINQSLLKRIFFTLSIISIIIAAGSFIFAYQQEKALENSQYGIVFAEEATVKSEPTTRSDELFLLHEGTKFEVLETYQDWIKLELANGIQGWIGKNDVRLL